MSLLTLFGLVAVGAMLVFYALEERSPIFVLAFAAACLLSSVYGFLQGAWPFGMVEGVWTVIALRRWRSRVQPGNEDAPGEQPIVCDMSAFTPDERQAYHALRARLPAAIDDVVETVAGFRARMSGALSPVEIVEWLTLERRCCPFLSVGLELRQDGSTWIRLEGPARVKAFVRDEFARDFGS